MSEMDTLNPPVVQPIKMDPELKAEWVAALRSGEYKQTTQRLRGLDDGRCCLGVLCDIAAAKGLGRWVQEDGSTWYFETDKDNGEALPPASISKWAFGTDENGYARTDNPEVPKAEPCSEYDECDEEHTDSLAGLNDAGYTFAEIATLIEVNL